MYNIPSKVVSVGTYTGDGAATKVISHTLGRIPRMIYLYDNTGKGSFFIARAAAGGSYIQATTQNYVSVAAPDPTDTAFTVTLTGDAANLNALGTVYGWCAW